MSTRDEAMEWAVRYFGDPDERAEDYAEFADALIAGGWRKMPSRDSALRAMWESRVGKCSDAEWAEERRRLTVEVYAAADAILALMDGGSA